MIDRLYEHSTLEDIKDVLNKISAEMNSLRTDIEDLKYEVCNLDIPLDVSNDIDKLELRVSELEN